MNVDLTYDKPGGIPNVIFPKAGKIAPGDFTGNPKKATIVFNTPFPDGDYTPSASTQLGDNRTITYETITQDGFIINLNAVPVIVNDVFWSAVKFNDV